MLQEWVDALYICKALEAANKRAQKAEKENTQLTADLDKFEQDNIFLGRHIEGLEKHFERAEQTNAELNAQLESAKRVNEMMKEKGIG